MDKEEQIAKSIRKCSGCDLSTTKKGNYYCLANGTFRNEMKQCPNGLWKISN